ncbi:MAG: 4Fe-4S dicluster domain-containing protein [Polyangiaceae bacterium]
MTPSTTGTSELDAPLVLDESGLGQLLQALRTDGYLLVGPRRVGQVIDYAPLEHLDELPRGIGSEQGPGHYRLTQHTGPDRAARFAYAAPASSFKRHFFVPQLILLRTKRSADGAGFDVLSEPRRHPKLALIGARSCDLHAIAMQDHILGGASEQAPADPDYVSRRLDVFVVAVNCSHPASTCFCTSTGTGPRADAYFDVALSELATEGGVAYVARAGSERGNELLLRLTTEPADAEQLALEEAVLDRAAQSIQRALPLTGLAAALQQNLESPIWDQIAERCLSCSNCTLACPTCFCSSVADSSSIDGQSAERSRRWDSCFTSDHSYVHGGSVRSKTSSRYRQWLTHKLSTWREQLGEGASVPRESADSSGCVGCGRCVTWCPAGIDITREAARVAGLEEQAHEVRNAERG